MSTSTKDVTEALAEIPHDERKRRVQDAIAKAAARAGGASVNGGSGRAPGPRVHPIPEDSLLSLYRDHVRKVSEAPDSWIVAPILTVCGKLLTPGVSIDFAGYKPLTIFNFVAGPAGLRKSTTFAPAENIARNVLAADAFVCGNASDSALFNTFEAQPHRLQLEDEGNKILQTWANTHHGRELSARYLSLYDGGGWGQNFRREAEENKDGKAERYIPRATISLCIGATFGVSRLDGIDAASGLRRRFGYYLNSHCARTIDWPESFVTTDWYALIDGFRRLLTVNGTIGPRNFTPEAFDLWKDIQRRNRETLTEVGGITLADETYSAALNETPSRVLKLAAIFQACRWAADHAADPFEINRDVLSIAEAHQLACLDAGRELEDIGRRAEIDDQAEAILAQARGLADVKQEGGEIIMTRTDLTRRFAANPGRRGALTASVLYGTIMPHLIRKGVARQLEGKGGYAIQLSDI